MNRKRAFPSNEEYGQLGIIESVSLRNFMCHDNLKFDFDPHMNFIIGRNGSGKSAVLTGIILALGGKSGATGRYSNIRGFIKTGKHSASACVTLKNCGPEAYKPNEYGEKIIVERHFTSDGVSSYKLKSQAGQILSTSKEELTNILNIMDIQIENPITVLTQDISRNFLLSKNSTGTKLFQLFYRGTGLAKVEEGYNRTVQQNEDAKKEVALKKEALPDMEKEVKTLKLLVDSSSKITELKNELLWAIVIEKEKIMKEEKSNYDKIKNEETVLQQKLTNCTTEINELNQLLTQVKAERNDCQDKMNQYRQALVTENTKRTPLAAEVREISGTLSRYDREESRLRNEITNLETMIKDIKLKNQTNVNEDKILHENAIQELKSDIEITANKARDLDLKKQTYHENHAELERQMDQCQSELQELEYKMKSIEREKQQLIEGKNNRVNVFGREMPHVLQEIRKAMSSGVFKVEPKGPIGMYINVKEPEWSFVIQECLKFNILQAFCCDNPSDAEQLSKIFSKYYSSGKARPSIITSKFLNQIHDVTPYKTVCRYPTVLDMLDIKDPVITNCLIDQKKIENILLIADKDEAINLMLYNPPKSCGSAYTLNGDQLYHSPYRNYAFRSKNRICILKNVNDEDIRKKGEELNAIEEALRNKNNKKIRFRQAIQKSSEDMKTINSDFIRFRTKLRELQLKLKDEENNYEEPKDINSLHGDLDKLFIERSKFVDEITSVKESLETKSKELHDLHEKVEKLKHVLQIEKDKFHELSSKSDETESKKETVVITQKKTEAQINALKPSIEKAHEALQNAVKNADVYKRNAETCSERINTKRSSQKIRDILDETEKTLREQRNCDPETLGTQFQEKANRLSTAKVELDKLHHLTSCFDKMMDKRFGEFNKICRNNVVSLTCCFTTLLKENDFTGYPDVNLKDQTLNIFAKPEKMNSKSTEKQNLAQLSGGERSYVTIAFLLALWDRIHMPFRILDEYDVFMDPNNRHLSINLLINAAKSNKNVQYIFLSPLELPPMEDEIDVKVHKMPAPKR